MAVIDFHCHLDLYDAPHEVVRECQRRRLYVLSVTTTPSAFEGTVALVPAGARIRTALGLHPELVSTRANELRKFAELLPRTAYVGEVGLDGSAQYKASFEKQCAVLAQILRLCKEAGGKVITLHSRRATERILDILAGEPQAGRFVLHWYLGTARQVARASDMGCWFSVGPAMLASGKGRTAVLGMPRERVIPESDGPFGKIGGRPAFPWDASSVIPKLAELWKEPEERIESRIVRAFRELVTPTRKLNLGAIQ